MLRFVLLAVIVAFALWWLLGRGRGRRGDAGAPGAPVAFAECAHCGVHLPRHEAIVERGLTFCCEAHRLAGPKAS